MLLPVLRVLNPPANFIVLVNSLLPVASWVRIKVALCPALMLPMELAVMLPVSVMVWIEPFVMSMLAAKLPVALPKAYTVSAKVNIFCFDVFTAPVPSAVSVTFPLPVDVMAKPLAKMLPARLPLSDPPPPPVASITTVLLPL